jgi:replication factor A1
MPPSQLSAGTCYRLHNAQTGDEDLFTAGHTVQFLSIKQVTPSATGNSAALDRYRIIISDGEHFLQAMLATQLNNLVYENLIGKNTVAVIEKLTCNFVQNKRLIIILALRVVSTDEEKIGSPVAIATPAPPQDQAAASNDANAVASSSAAAAIPHEQPPAQPPRQQASAQRSGRTGSIYPIEGLSPYQNNWTIKARVTQKSDIKIWSNQRGEGKLFNVTLMDESGEIRGTGFNQVVDDLYDKLEEGKVYFVSKARVNLAKKKFSNLSNDYELSLEKNTEIEECHEAAGVPMIKYNFVELSGLEDLSKDAVCDVIGVVKSRGELASINSKAGRVIPKRELTLVDKSGFSVVMTLWGKQAEDYNAEENVIIAFRGVKVGDFGGRSLSMYSSSTMSINPEIDECFALRGWYDAIGAESSFQSHTNNFSGGAGNSGAFERSQLRDLNEVKTSQVGLSDKGPENFSTRATIMHIKPETISYPACQTPSCNKKVTESGGSWRCEKCDQSFPKPQYRYLISMAVADWSGQAWLQGFNDAGLAVFGKTADELNEIKERDESEYNVIMHRANCNTFNFACRAKQDTYNDQTRVRYGISRILPLNYSEEAAYLRDLLRSPWAQ